jgi:hypothetical protein
MLPIREGFQKARLEELRMLVEVAESGCHTSIWLAKDSMLASEWA